MSTVQMKRFLISLACIAGSIGLSQGAGAVANSASTSGQGTVLLAAANEHGGPVVAAAASHQLAFADRAFDGRTSDDKSTDSRDWSMILVGMFLIVAITGRRARTMFD